MLKQESITFHNQNQYEIELDCIAVKVEYEPEAIEKISSIIWYNSPLLGELIMGAEEINELLSAGMHIFKKIMSNPHAMLTRMEQQLLIHSCVVLTQEQERETSDGKLWDYILERLGYDKTKNHYFGRNLDFEYSYNEKIQSLMVEGGRILLQSFIDAGYWDEAYIECSKILLKEGVRAPHLPERLNSVTAQIMGATIKYTVNQPEKLENLVE